MAKSSKPKRRKAKSAPKRTAAKIAAKPGTSADSGTAFCRAVEAALRRGKAPAITETQLRRVMTAAIKAYAAQSEEAGREIAPFLAGTVTATEAVVAACAIIRAVDLNLFDVAMWFRRPVAG